MADHGENLSADRWRRVKEVFGAALEHAPADRDAFLDQVCGAGKVASGERLKPCWPLTRRRTASSRHPSPP